MQKDFSQQPGEPLLAWLLQCWDIMANGVTLDGNKAKQFTSLFQHAGIDQGIGKRSETLSFCIPVNKNESCVMTQHLMWHFKINIYFLDLQPGIYFCSWY